MSSLGYGFGEELAFEVAIVQVVQTKTGQNLLTSRLCVHDEISAAFMKACLVIQVIVLAGFLLPNGQEKRLSALCSMSFLHTVLLVCCWLKTVSNLQSFMGSRHRKSNSQYEDEGKSFSCTYLGVG